MPKRWYISPIVGTGTDDDPYRAKVGGSAQIKGHSAVIPTDAQGVPQPPPILVVYRASARQGMKLLRRKYVLIMPLPREYTVVPSTPIVPFRIARPVQSRITAQALIRLGRK